MDDKTLLITDVVGYLPYRLKLLDEYGETIIANGFDDEWILSNNNTCEPQYSLIEKCKPILRPMSDLLKFMVHPDINNGEEFTPLSLIFSNWEYVHKINYIDYNRNGEILVSYVASDGEDDLDIIDLHPYVVKILSKLHFDYNNLIDCGLAIDNNTL